MLKKILVGNILTFKAKISKSSFWNLLESESLHIEEQRKTADLMKKSTSNQSHLKLLCTDI